jgi:hypothetical protein
LAAAFNNIQVHRLRRDAFVLGSLRNQQISHQPVQRDIAPTPVRGEKWSEMEALPRQEGGGKINHNPSNFSPL